MTLHYLPFAVCAPLNIVLTGGMSCDALLVVRRSGSSRHCRRHRRRNSAAVSCYPTGSLVERCFASGSSADDHDQIDMVSVAVAVGPLIGVTGAAPVLNAEVRARAPASVASFVHN